MRRTLAVVHTNLQLCLLEIVANKLRSFITTLGVFLGIAALLVNVAFIRAMEDDVRESMESIGGLKIVTVIQKEPTSVEEMRQFQRSPGLTLRQGEQLARESPYIAACLPQEDLGWTRIHSSGKRSHARGKAVGMEYLDLYNYRISRGRGFDPVEHARGLPVCIIGGGVVERLFEHDNPLGKTVLIDHHPFEIIGILHTESMRQQQAREVLIPFSVYKSKFAGRFSSMEELTFLLYRSEDAEAAQQDLNRRLTFLHRGANDFEVQINLDKIKDMQAASMGMKILLSCIAAISLLVGGISIMNIMFATIGDRIREIGLRKALGARRVDIFTQFLIEAVLLCFVGGIPGMVLGGVITFVPPDVFPFTPRLSIADYSLAIGFTVAVGVVSGLFPSLKAAGMKPVEALRY